MPKKANLLQTPDFDSTLKGRRIFFVLFNLELGGAERQALILAKHLVEHEEAVVEVCGFKKSGPVADMCEELGVPWHLDSFLLEKTRNGRLLSFDRIAKSLQRARPEILLPYTFVPNVICGLGWQRTGARACVWNQRDEGLTPFVAEWARSAAERTPMFVSNAGAARSFWFASWVSMERR